jgi:hypothetical protein
MGAALGSCGATDGGGSNLMLVVVAGTVVVGRVVVDRERVVVGAGTGVVGGSVAGGWVAGGGVVGGWVAGGTVVICARAGVAAAAHIVSASTTARPRVTRIPAGRR